MDKISVHEKSVFVKIEEYKEALSLFTSLKTQLQKTKDILAKINDLKKEEQAEIELWGSSINEIEKKFEFIDRNINES